jgi:hypothetical protein
MILERLIEKKDLLAYIKWRKKVLGIERFNIPKILKPKDREGAIRQMKGRIKELRMLSEVIHGDVKSHSKEMSRRYYELTRKAAEK